MTTPTYSQRQRDLMDLKGPILLVSGDTIDSLRSPRARLKAKARRLLTAHWETSVKFSETILPVLCPSTYDDVYIIFFTSEQIALAALFRLTHDSQVAKFT